LKGVEIMNLLGKWSVAWWLKLVLDVGWYLLLLVSAGVTLMTLGAALTQGGTDAQVKVHIQFDLEKTSYKISAPSWGIENAELDKAHADLAFTNPGGIQAAILMAWSNAMFLIALVAVYQLRRIFQTLAAGEPFHPNNAYRIRLIGFTIIATQPLGALMQLAMAKPLQEALHAEGLRAIEPAWGFNLAVVLFGMMLLVIAEAFRIGAEMKKEQDLTV